MRRTSPSLSREGGWGSGLIEVHLDGGGGRSGAALPFGFTPSPSRRHTLKRFFVHQITYPSRFFFGVSLLPTPPTHPPLFEPLCRNGRCQCKKKK